MNVLGLSDGMTGGTALIADGTLTYAVHEERLSRHKMATGFPRQSLTHILEATHMKPSEVDVIAVATVNEFFRDPALPYDGWLLKEQAPLKEALLSASSVVNGWVGSNGLLKRSYYELKSVLGRTRRKKLTDLLQREWGFTCPIKFIDHHFAHACSAYFTSGFDDATVMTMDGAGDHVSSRVYAVQNGRFRQQQSVDSFNSVGNYYAYVTHLCGFKAQKHEGKVTGLAAYGEPLYVDLLKRFIRYDNGRMVNVGQVFYWPAVKALVQALPRHFRREDLACSMQQVLEEVVCAYVRHWVGQTQYRQVALAGGVFANVKLNQRIHELPQVHDVFIHPGMGDEGLAVGAAFAVSSAMPEQRPSEALQHAYLGPGYTEPDIQRALQQGGAVAQYEPDIEHTIAELLATGAVVARVDGRMEYGPRALGNRSILAPPTDASVNDRLNKRLRRTEFMPFAPVTLSEWADQCYEGLHGARTAARFMTVTFDCTPWMKRTCPAVVHIDGTARPQVIDPQVAPGYYKIVDAYRKLTGLPSLINTSFNMHEEPMVCSPEDALRAFRASGLDYLAIGSWLVRRPGAAQAESFGA